MGMYDNIGVDQVKCFNICHYNKEYFEYEKTDKYYDILKNINFSCGGLRYFDRGKVVPYKTLWYDYGKNFMIMSHWEFDDIVKDIFHIIKDGKVYKSIEGIENIKDEHFSIVDKIIDYYGNEIINIKNLDDFLEYKENHRKYRTFSDELSKKSHDLLQEMGRISRESKGLSGHEKDLKTKEFEEVNNKFKEYKKFENNELSLCRQKYLSRYEKDEPKEFELYEALGVMFHCYRYLEQESSKNPPKEEWEIDLYNRTIDNFNYLKIDLKTLLTKENILEDYLNWNRPTQKGLKEIEYVLDKIKKEEA